MGNSLATNMLQISIKKDDICSINSAQFCIRNFTENFGTQSHATIVLWTLLDLQFDPKFDCFFLGFYCEQLFCVFFRCSPRFRYFSVVNNVRYIISGGDTAPVTGSGSPENGSSDDLIIQPAISTKLNHVSESCRDNLIRMDSYAVTCHYSKPLNIRTSQL